MTNESSERSTPRSLVVGTAGHIDHGKSSLVRALTGVDPDRLKEEKSRGITIDLGFANVQEGALNLAFVDVPGHERFVRNMLAGASGIDCVLLVVAADESVMPQTREHFDICRLLGVSGGVVAITKADLVDAETVEIVRLEVADLVAGSFLEAAPVVTVSARSGDGLDELRRELSRQAGDERRTGETGAARIPVDRAFTVRGFGTVVTGTQVSGQIRVGEELELLPSKRRVKVRGLQIHGAGRDTSGAGQRVAVNVTGVEVDDLARGDTLVKPDGFEVTRRLDATVEVLADARPLRHGARVRFHAGTSEVMARVSLSGDPDDEGGGLAALEPGQRAYGRLRLERPVVLTRGDRFVLRAYSPPLTVAGGRVLDPSPARGRFRTPAGFARLRRLDAWATPDAAVVAMVHEAGTRGLSRERLTPRAGIAPADVEELVRRLVAEDGVDLMGDVLIDADRLGELSDELLGWVETHHHAHPLDLGLPREEARERLGRRAAPAIFDPLVARLVGEGRLSAQQYLAQPAHRIALSDEEQQVRDGLVAHLRDAGLTPPEVATVAQERGWSREVADRMVMLLVREGAIVRVDTLVFDSSALERLKDEMRAVKKDAGEAAAEIDVGTFKQRYGMTRKYAIPLLGYLDRERVTRRMGNVRVIL